MFSEIEGVLPRQQLVYIAIIYNRHLAVDCKTGEIVFEVEIFYYELLKSP